MEKQKSLGKKHKFSADWFVKGILIKTGEAFDRFTGRNWKPSSLATSELTEKIRQLLDREVRDLGPQGKFAPHHIKLKMQWDKFSTDSEQSIEKLRNELHAAAVDHINDRRYYTYAPLSLEVKPDYFTDGVILTAAFETFDNDQAQVGVNVSMPNLAGNIAAEIPEKEPESSKEVFVAIFSVDGRPCERLLAFSPGERKSVGRTAENDLVLDENSVTKKSHATLAFNSQKTLMVADTGSTNGTFVNGRRISNNSALAVAPGDILTFGSVDVELRQVPAAAEAAGNSPRPDDTEASGNERLSELTSTFAPGVPGESTQIGNSGPLSAPERVAGKAEEADANDPTREGIILDFSDEHK